MRFAVIALAFAGLALGGCHHDPEPMHPKEGELPPLPPASGTAVGYLVDSAGELALRDDQLKKLKDIDASLAARNADLDTQLRQLEKPADEEELSPQQQKAGAKKHRYNNAPGASTVTNGDAGKLHRMHDDNDRQAVTKALALLDPDQVTKAKKILQDRGVPLPGQGKQAPPSGDDGTPLPGGEP